MTFLERTTRADRLRSWPGDMEADYRYTSGVAGERFFTALRDEGRILAAHCGECHRLYLPPRAYCERCLGPTDDWRPVEGPATIEAVTALHIDRDGSPLPEPQTWALLRWAGVYGGLVHRLAIAPGRAQVGMKVRPVLRPRGERVGDIRDILHFAP